MAAAALLPFLLFLTPVLRLLPTVALGAIVIFAGAQLVDLDQFARLYRISRLSFMNALLVTLGVLVIGVVPGIVVGVMLSLMVLLGRLARPVLVFANADHFMERVRRLVAACQQPVRWVLVDVQAVTDIDVTAAEMLVRLGAELEAQGIAFKFARANRPLREQIVRLGLGEHLQETTVYPSVHAAIEAFSGPPGGAEPAGIDASTTRQEAR